MSKGTSARETLAEMGLMRVGEPDPLEIAYAFAHAMVLVDGRIDPDELFSTARLGADLYPGFDAREFETRCRSRTAPPTLDQLAPLLVEVLDDQARRTLYRFLLAISQSDAEVSVEESELLRAVARDLGLDVDGT